jgi:sugar lactone lactonase YvrE
VTGKSTGEESAGGWTPEWRALPGERFALGEGLRRAGDRTVMVDILSGRLLELPAGLDGPPRALATLDEPLGAVAPRPGGGWWAAAGTGIAVLSDAPGGSDGPGGPGGPGGPDGPDGPGGSPAVRWLARPEDGAATPMRMNDAALDPHGRFWAGSMAYDQTDGAGSLYRADPDGSVTRVLTGLTVPNGPVFSADGTAMFLADSAKGLIRRYPVDPVDGRLGEAAAFASVATGSPDGMTLDAEGHLWSAIWGTGELRRWSPLGRLDRVVELPAEQPTSVLLTGGRLLVTTAATGLPAPGEWDGAVLHTSAPAGA